MQNENKEKSNYQTNREKLKELSVQVKPLVKAGDYENTNEAVIENFYKDTENTEFHTFRGWLQLGFVVKRGSKGFPIWAHPKKWANPSATPTAEEERDYFPLAYLFSDAQVDKSKSEVQHEHA